MNSRSTFALLALATLTVACQRIDEPQIADSEDVMAETEEDATTVNRAGPETGALKSQDPAQENNLFVPSNNASETRTMRADPSGIGTSPADGALKYKEQANEVTRSMQEQARETEQHMKR